MTGRVPQVGQSTTALEAPKTTVQCARCGLVSMPQRVLDANHAASFYCATCAQETAPVDP